MSSRPHPVQPVRKRNNTAVLARKDQSNLDDEGVSRSDPLGLQSARAWTVEWCYEQDEAEKTVNLSLPLPAARPVQPGGKRRW